MSTPTEDLRLENLLGALSVAVGDRMESAFDEACAVGDSAPAALNLIHENPDTRIEGLARFLDLSHSGTVRLVDRLKKQGWVARETCEDKRAVVLVLTDAGKVVADRLRAERHRSLSDAFEGLNSSERRTLGKLFARMLNNLVQDQATADRTCRYCDGEVCTAWPGCPIDPLPEK